MVTLTEPEFFRMITISDSTDFQSIMEADLRDEVMKDIEPGETEYLREKFILLGETHFCVLAQYDFSKDAENPERKLLSIKKFDNEAESDFYMAVSEYGNPHSELSFIFN